MGITYSFDRSSIVALSDASKMLFTDLAFRGISGPNSLNGIITSKILPSFSFSTMDSPISPKRGTSVFFGGEIAGLGGTVRSVRPIVQYKHFIPMQKGRNTVGFNVQGSFLTGYGGVVAPPFERFYMGGENDLRGFDIRSVSPVAFLPNKSSITLPNPDGTAVPKDPDNPLRGAYTIPVPVEQIVFPGGDASLVSNLEYRITIAGPVRLAPFVDVGMDPIIRGSQLRINPGQLGGHQHHGVRLSRARYCPELCRRPSQNPVLAESADCELTNWIPRMSTGLEFQVFLPVINAPFRVYWAYNPLRLDTFTRGRCRLPATCSRPEPRATLPSSRPQSALRPSFSCESRARRFDSPWRPRSRSSRSVVRSFSPQLDRK